MVTWADFEQAAPALAAGGRRLLLQYDLGLGYLATIRPDGGPRLHPFCPILAKDGLWGFIGPSPKRHDLLRDGRCAIHSFPRPDGDDEFTVYATAVEETDSDRIAAVRAAYEAPIQSMDETLFEFRIRNAMLALYDGQPSWPPTYTKWSAG